ncbi:MAG: ferritin-like domain-containing protein [Mastigocoleus sp. MO_167.B18]|nr:ferritin-like domain-containing protein [Mastigocoleus sp. MO_167.B18]
MKEFESNSAINLLQTIFEFELAGAIRYTNFAALVDNEKVDIVDFLKEQARESLEHSQKVGDVLVRINGYNQPNIAPIDRAEGMNIKDILQASHEFERQAISLYQNLLDVVKDCNLYLEEFARHMVTEEAEHSQELEQMLREYC